MFPGFRSRLYLTKGGFLKIPRVADLLKKRESSEVETV